MRILLVDDDLFAAELASVYLEMSGYEVVIAGSAMEALSMFGGNMQFDMVISDLHMPDLSGLDLLEMLRSQEWNRPFILLSANEETASEVKFDRWVKKDANLAVTLVAAVNEILQQNVDGE